MYTLHNPSKMLAGGQEAQIEFVVANSEGYWIGHLHMEIKRDIKLKVFPKPFEELEGLRPTFTFNKWETAAKEDTVKAIVGDLSVELEEWFERYRREYHQYLHQLSDEEMQQYFPLAEDIEAEERQRELQ